MPVNVDRCQSCRSVPLLPFEFSLVRLGLQETTEDWDEAKNGLSLAFVGRCFCSPFFASLTARPQWRGGIRVREWTKRNIGRGGLCLEAGAAYVSAGTGLGSWLALTGKLPARRDAELGEDMGEVGFGRAR